MTWKNAIIGATLLGLCACGGGSTPATETTTTKTAVTKTAVTEKTGLAQKDLCEFLTQEAPKLKAFGPGGTGDAGLANFTLALNGWVEKDPATHTPKTAAELDEVSSAGCPAARTDILEVLESPSFDKAFGG